MHFRLPLVCAMLAVAATAVASPPYVNFQGILTDVNGNPLAAGAYKMEFAIYDDPLAGTRQWGPFVCDGGSSVGHATLVNLSEAGRFNVILGPNDTAGKSIVDAFAADALFVEIRVDEGDPILPRQQFLSAPFAFRLPGVVTKDGKVGIGTKNPEADLHILSDDNPRLKLQSGDTGFDILYDGTPGSEMLAFEGVQAGASQGRFLQMNPADGATTLTGDLALGGNLDMPGGARARRPFKIHKFGPLGDNVVFNTEISDQTSDCIIAGFDSGYGDIQEEHAGDIIKVYCYRSGGTWRVRADFRSHDEHESWTVWVLEIDRRLCERGWGV